MRNFPQKYKRYVYKIGSKYDPNIIDTFFKYLYLKVQKIYKIGSSYDPTINNMLGQN